ncbi:DUF4283 domain-containing protein [Cephalotus follicularis]|uniref:DUF4283 domain-containing protein n=1 Tax=Cephalotus follicularis TaxID=3775 RepID=A0A1Q3BA15_CEPFO|nr:DUF4283 domain-containing protein [Cephalotus follicularis]
MTIKGSVLSEPPNPRSPLSYTDKLLHSYGSSFLIQARSFVPEFDEGSNEEDEDSGHDLSIPIILISREEKERIRAPWIHILIVKVFCRSVGYHYLLTKIHQIWHSKGKLSMVDLGLNFYSVKFSLQDDFSFVLSGGPWFIGQNFLNIYHWEHEFKATVASVTMMVVWIRLVELPLEVFDSTILSKTCNELGTL